MARYIEVAHGVRYAYEDRGEGPPVLLVHGWGTSRRVWEGPVRALVDRYRLITVDWRGCGESDAPAHGNHVRTVGADLAAVIEQLHLEPLVAVGSSLGGNAVLELALQRPELVRAAALVDAPQHFFADGLDPATFTAWVDSLSGRRAEVVQSMVMGWFGPGGSQALRAWTESQLLVSSWFIDDTLRSAQHHDRRADLTSLHMPVALVHGAHDREVPVSVSRLTASLLPRGELHVLPDAGHMPALVDPVAFTRLLSDLLRRWHP